MLHIAHKLMTRVLGALAVAGLVSVSIQEAKASQWQMPNQGGGEIIVEDTACVTHPDMYSALSYTSDGHTIQGCWLLINQQVLEIMWWDGTQSTFELSRFRAVAAPIQKQRYTQPAPMM